MPKRIQRKRTKGWKMPLTAKYVGRGSRYGNPFTIGCNAAAFGTTVPFACPQTLTEVLADYRYYADKMLVADPHWLDDLRGYDACCWCRLDRACHGDILLELANRVRYVRGPMNNVYVGDGG